MKLKLLLRFLTLTKQVVMLKGVSKFCFFCSSMNRSFDEGIYPDIWKPANIIPIFKKGDKSQPSNYRPVALLSCVGKLQERTVFKNVYNFLLGQKSLIQLSIWFLTSPLNSVSVNWYVSQYMHLIVFCDVSKDIDRVWHNGLWFKLRHNDM